MGLLAISCGDSGSQAVPVPAGFPEMRVPEANPYSEAKFEFGRFLFYDKRLSKNELQACASCHEQELAFTDGLKTPLGSTGDLLTRNSQSLSNVGFNASLTWANPTLVELETQLLIPIFAEDPIELGATGAEDEILARINGDPTYGPLFEAAFPDAATMEWEHVVFGLSSFTRGLVSGNSAFDKFSFQEDKTALTDQQRRGLELFFSEKLECHHCHGGFNFTEATVHDGSAFDARLFHNTGLYNIDGFGGFPPGNTGVFEITGMPGDMGRFRPPTLRNIEVTAPYMHDGSIETLEDVLRFYEDGGRLIEDGPFAGDGRVSPLKSGLVPGFSITDAEREDLIAFLKSLTDHEFITNPRLSDPWRQ